jgi:hypothetical protein
MKKFIIPIITMITFSGCATVSEEDGALCATFVQLAHGLAFKQGKQLTRAEALRAANAKDATPDPDGGRATVGRLIVHMVNFAYDNQHLSSNQFETAALGECSRWLSRN